MLSVKLVSNPSSKAADKRWSRNLSANTASTPAGETADRDSIQFSAAGSANLFSPARGPAQEPGGFPAEGCCGHSGAKASQAEQAPLLPRPPDDVVLTFCIHRFDRYPLPRSQAVLCKQDIVRLRVNRLENQSASLQQYSPCHQVHAHVCYVCCYSCALLEDAMLHNLCSFHHATF